MYKGKKVLGVITARGGSKGLPGKNIKPLAGKPLIAWTIKQALESRYVDKVVVSTDDKKIAEVSRKAGASVPFLRPAYLATDTASSADAVMHAIGFLADKGETYDYIALLEPTSPLRKKGDIDRGIKKLIDDKRGDSLVSVGEVHLEHPMIVKKIVKGVVTPYGKFKKIHQRQQADKAYFPYGVLYLSKISKYGKEKTFYGKKTLPLFIERWQNYEIDDSVDFDVIEKLFGEYRKFI